MDKENISGVVDLFLIFFLPYFGWATLFAYFMNGALTISNILFMITMFTITSYRLTKYEDIPTLLLLEISISPISAAIIVVAGNIISLNAITCLGFFITFVLALFDFIITVKSK